MKIEFEGRTWQVELEEVDMMQADKITAYTGLSLMAWYKSLLDTDSLAWNKSVRGLYWLMRDQNGESDGTPLESLNFAPVKLFSAFATSRAADTGEAAEEDPTKPAGGNAAASPEPPQQVISRAG